VKIIGGNYATQGEKGSTIRVHAGNMVKGMKMRREIKSIEKEVTLGEILDKGKRGNFPDGKSPRQGVTLQLL